MLDSAALGGPRAVTVYRPPRHEGPLPGCVLADGGSARSFADTLEPAILAGTVPPVLVVGAHNAVDPANLGADRRAQEYLFGASIGRQCIESGLVDELLIHLVPVLLGDGLRLFDKPGSKQVPLERLSRGQSATPR